MKNKIRKIAKIPTIWLGKVLLLGLFLTGLNTASVFAVDFITKAEFEAEKSTYKDYPFKILFKKLAEGDAAEKRIIRNTIILKQAFDRNMQEKIKGGVINYKETFGIVKESGQDHLKLWIPKNDSTADFYVGIDRIPTINEHNYQVTESNIGKYAVVIYSLDDRIYQIKISFQPASPAGLIVKREVGKNIVSWNQPAADQKPVGYKFFINEEPFERVDKPIIKVPRTIGQADEYYVKAIYKHGDSFIESDASDIQIDEITAKEVQQEVLAWETYDRIITALNPSQWQDAEKLLYDNQQFLSEHLDAERKQKTAGLVAFFTEIDEGDRLGTATPESVQNLESALMFYQRAETKANSMPAAIDVVFIPRLKTAETQGRIAKLNAVEKEFVAARNAKAATITTSKAPEPSEKPEPIEKIVDRDTEIKVAMKDFKTRDYVSALNHFENIYSSQIANLKQPGDKSIRGLLSLPLKHRAEVIFLIELDRLRKENNNDEELIKQRLEMIYENIDNGEGLWSIIPESKRKLIKRHIEKYGT
ncbi:MAG: hypothetical protein ISS65_12000 [Desulfobacterales bacterium]|uniref:Uncharacterized protein n=1 Tax=Candidatus Desulfatibia profunda TaxID=2841695 RepID=A0A8J6NNQ3_9BACT|nr:hypothetical protein [Candidatus Desulfatibia profunda]MBL7180906.1 hypothetical protein [Desulfobacterales bacterium]